MPKPLDKRKRLQAAEVDADPRTDQAFLRAMHGVVEPVTAAQKRYIQDHNRSRHDPEVRGDKRSNIGSIIYAISCVVFSQTSISYLFM